MKNDLGWESRCLHRRSIGESFSLRIQRLAVIRVCSDHGYFDEQQCPVCDTDGREVLSEDRRVQLSKFMSGALRHFPTDVGLSVDSNGWVDREELVTAVLQKYSWADPDHIEAVIATDPKGRFECHGVQIRAAYGHSISVDLDQTEAAIPDRLYHGTAPRNLDTIADDGLKSMNRQLVHLSETPAAAREVGSRHADEPIVLTIDAKGLAEDGVQIDKRGEDTFTVDRVAPKYIEECDEEPTD